MKNLIGIIAADPNSINSEIIAKVWKKKAEFKNLNIFIIGNYILIKKQLEEIKVNLNLKKISKIQKQNFKKKLLIYDVPLKFNRLFNISSKAKSNYVINSFKIAIKLMKGGKILGLINCPINKIEIFGNKFFGTTEFLAKKEGVLGREVMLLYNKQLSVSPITTHIKLKKVSRNISKKKIVDKLITINKFFLKKLKMKPKIGILGLNPHNDEFRKNSEERKFIIPAIKQLRKKRVSVEGPLSPDTAFLDFKKKGFNILVGMYHDQVLSPFKLLFKFDAINITLGIPYIRISPDHGTGKNLIKKNLANPKSLMKCIKFFNNRNVKT
jgi:4-hydroxythreonine-4-phosphate dehydrogenase